MSVFQVQKIFFKWTFYFIYIYVKRILKKEINEKTQYYEWWNFYRNWRVVFYLFSESDFWLDCIERLGKIIIRSISFLFIQMSRVSNCCNSFHMILDVNLIEIISKNVLKDFLNLIFGIYDWRNLCGVEFWKDVINRLYFIGIAQIVSGKEFSFLILVKLTIVNHEVVYIIFL